jgi:hypothetical protein
MQFVEMMLTHDMLLFVTEKFGELAATVVGDKACTSLKHKRRKVEPSLALRAGVSPLRAPALSLLDRFRSGPDTKSWRSGKKTYRRPASSWERGWRWTRRHPALVGVSAALVRVIAASVAGLSML